MYEACSYRKKQCGFSRDISTPVTQPLMRRHGTAPRNRSRKTKRKANILDGLERRSWSGQIIKASMRNYCGGRRARRLCVSGCIYLRCARRGSRASVNHHQFPAPVTQKPTNNREVRLSNISTTQIPHKHAPTPPPRTPLPTRVERQPHCLISNTFSLENDATP